MGEQALQTEPATTTRVVVLAVDESASSDYAFEYFMQNVYQKDDRIVLVHCPEYRALIQSQAAKNGDIIHIAVVLTDVAVMTNVMHEEEKRVRALLEKFGEKLKSHGVGGKVKSVGGKPGEAIVEVARDEGAILIVTGNRGMGTLRRTLVGSVSDYILHHSPVPVLVCRQRE